MTCAAAIAINQLDLEVLRFFFAYKEGGELPREIKGDILHFDYKPRVVRGIQPLTSVDATEAEEKKNGQVAPGGYPPGAPTDPYVHV